MRYLDALKNQYSSGCIPVIPDIKCISPKDGDLMRGRDPRAIAKELADAGAPAISVVTEAREFGGSMELLREICAAVCVPVLRKDFIETEADLDETKEAGAAAILLMISCLGTEKLTALYHAAISRGLTPFVETHDAKELDFALHTLKAPLIGINNRNILVLERDDGDVSLTRSLLSGVESGDAFIVAESSMQTPEDVRSAIRAGAHAALVGTGILLAPSPARMYRQMAHRTGLKICGLMSEADVDACLQHAVDICGFVTKYPVPVRWNLSAEMALPLIRRAEQGGSKTCIVTGGNVDDVVSLARQLRPDYVQLHYRETLEETGRIARALHEERISVIRSVPLSEEERLAMFHTGSFTEALQALDASLVDAILIDSRDAGNAADGGTGLFGQCGIPSELAYVLKDIRKPLLCGGGITAENAAEIISAMQPDYLDVMTGAESPDGKKSAGRIRQIEEAAARNGAFKEML